MDKEDIIEELKKKCPVHYTTESSLKNYRFCTTDNGIYSTDWLLTGIIPNDKDDVSFQVRRILSNGNISSAVETVHPQDFSYNQLRTILSYTNVKL